MNKQQEQEIIKQAFYEELEKDAAWSALSKLFLKAAPKLTKTFPQIGKKAKDVGKFFGSKGKISGSVDEASFNWGLKNLKAYSEGARQAFAKSNKAGYDYLKAHAKSGVTKTKGGKYKFTQAKPSAGQKGATSGFLQRVVGTTARELEFLGKGVSLKNPLTTNISQLSKNISDDVARQWNAASYRTVSKKTIGNKPNQKFEMVTKGKDKYLKSKKAKVFKNRKVVGYDSKGNPITRKRTLAQAAAVAGTPVGFAGISAALGDPEEGAKDYMKWKTPYGPLELLYDVAKPGE